MAAPQPTPADSPLLPGRGDPAVRRRRACPTRERLPAPHGRLRAVRPARRVERLERRPGRRAHRGRTVAAACSIGGATQSSFDNSPAGGGAPDNAANPTAWVGGTLSVVASWTGSSLLAYPDARTARLTVTALDGADTVLATDDFAIPAPSVQAYTLSQLVPDPASRASPTRSPIPPLTAHRCHGPGGVADPDRRPRRRHRRSPSGSRSGPGPVDPAADVRPAGVVATLPGGQRLAGRHQPGRVPRTSPPTSSAGSACR